MSKSKSDLERLINDNARLTLLLERNNGLLKAANATRDVTLSELSALREGRREQFIINLVFEDKKFDACSMKLTYKSYLVPSAGDSVEINNDAELKYKKYSASFATVTSLSHHRNGSIYVFCVINWAKVPK